MRRLLILSVAAAIAGCSLTEILDDPIPAADGPRPPYEECEAEEYLYIGRNTLRALGLDDVSTAQESGADAARAGMIWVTADLLPVDFGPPGGEIESRQMLCIEFLDGSGMSSPLDEPWRAPGVASEGGDDDASAALPIGMIGVALIVVAAVGVSVFAFRRRPKGPPT